MQNIQNPGGIIVIIGSFYYQNSTIKFINMFMVWFNKLISYEEKGIRGSNCI